MKKSKKKRKEHKNEKNNKKQKKDKYNYQYFIHNYFSNMYNGKLFKKQ